MPKRWVRRLLLTTLGSGILSGIFFGIGNIGPQQVPPTFLSMVLVIIGGVLGVGAIIAFLSAYVGAVARVAQIRQWGWLTLLLVFWILPFLWWLIPIFLIIYAINGPDAAPPPPPPAVVYYQPLPPNQPYPPNAQPPAPPPDAASTQAPLSPPTPERQSRNEG